MSRKEALDFHAQCAWDKTDKATKDVTRYQSNPAQATAYMLGQLEIWSLRNLTQRRFEEAGIKFNKKEFHHQVMKARLTLRDTGPFVLDWIIFR